MPFWSCARTLTQREAFASERLQASGFETLLPRVKTADRGIVPLFSGYVFVRIVDRWRSIDWTVGVLKLVSFGAEPARVPDREIETLRARMTDGVVVLPPPPSPHKRKIAAGTKVAVIGGPLEGLSGIHTGMTQRDREFVLLTILGSARQVAIPSNLVVAR
jgi:transcriptional antiterminator RfaH